MSGVVPTEAMLEQNLQGKGGSTLLFEQEGALHEGWWFGGVGNRKGFVTSPFAWDGFGVVCLPLLESEEFGWGGWWGEGVRLGCNLEFIEDVVFAGRTRPVIREDAWVRHLCSGFRWFGEFAWEVEEGEVDNWGEVEENGECGGERGGQGEIVVFVKGEEGRVEEWGWEEEGGVSVGERGKLLCSQGGSFGIGAQFVGVHAEALGNDVVVLSNDEGCDVVVRVGERVEEDGGRCVSRI